MTISVIFKAGIVCLHIHKINLKKKRKRIIFFSLKINEFVQFSQEGVYFFRLLMKIPLFELNNRFEFRRL